MGRGGDGLSLFLYSVIILSLEHVVAVTISQDHILLLQQYVMEGLGLTRLPDSANMNISQSEYTTKYDTYLQTVRENKRLRQQRDTTQTSQRFYSFTHYGEAPLVKNYQGDHSVLFFPVGVKNATVNQATLRIFAIGPLGQSPPTLVTLKVYQKTEGPRIHLGTRSQLLQGSRWFEMDVASAVSSWVSGQARNLGLEVECEHCQESQVRLLIDRQSSGPSFAPVLNTLLTEREPYPRSPRAMEGDAVRYDDSLGSDCRKGPNRGRCCRHSLEIVFKDVPGFEFILQPYKFNAGFCKGRCPPRYHPASQHALLQSLVWQMYHVPKPCCAPHVLADIEVLHLDETDPSSLKVSTWKGMQVQRCACS